MSINAFLAGSTGLVGSHILTTLLAHPDTAHASAFTRRPLPHSSPKLSTLPADPNTTSDPATTWPTLFPTPAPSASLFLSALGTTRGQAGSLAAQRVIDYDLNLSLAQAARAAGIKTYVLISTGAASSGSSFPYLKMKGELEDAVQALGFEHTVVVRPGVLLGERQDSRPAEAAVRKVAWLAGLVANVAKDCWAQDAEVVARAAVKAGMLCVDGRREKGVWVLNQADVVRLGRTEWTDGEKVGE